MTSDMIQLPNAIDPEARHVEFRVTACREQGCDATGPVALANNPIWWEWGNTHADETGHKRFYQYTLTRNFGEITTVGATVKRRRALGQR